MGRRSDIKPLPLLARLQELLSYDENSGVLMWKVRPATSRSNICFNNKCGGKIAGTTNEDSYVVIGIAKRSYLAHRIIWKLMTDSDPIDQIDHEDGDRANNCWRNLRQTSNGPNIQNSKRRKDNKSGIKGVFWDRYHQSWIAAIGINGKQIRLGRFKDIEQASEARRTASEKMHGQFARAS